MKEVQNNSLSNELTKMVLSASGWRKIFAASGELEDNTKLITETDKILVCHIANSFLEFLKSEAKQINTIVLGRDSRPTGEILEEILIKIFSSSSYNIKVIGITAAPEIMAYSKSVNAAFVYISASHNPIGYNGFKFGLNNGGVIDANKSKKIITAFQNMCMEKNAIEKAYQLLEKSNFEKVEKIKKQKAKLKKEALDAYLNFSKEVIANSADKKVQEEFFNNCKATVDKQTDKGYSVCIVADFNGSARACSIDRSFFKSIGISMVAIGEEPGNIQHAILPEGENLKFCAQKMQELHNDKDNFIAKNSFLGYMPDCDGDRGNLIYWDKDQNKPVILEAQEVFLLSVIAELGFILYTRPKVTKALKKIFNPKLAIAVNGPTSLRVEEAATYFGAEVFRAEVGEANVVNLSKKLREEKYIVRILGEGSNGGNITHPASVRDPLNTIFAILKLLLIRTDKTKKGIFHLWCEKSKQMHLYKEDFSMSDIIKTLPKYLTTSTGDERAILKISTEDHSILKEEYQKIFEKEWEEKKAELKEKFGIIKYKAICNKGTEEIQNPENFSVSGRGGLKIQFYNSSNKAVAFIWMRGSGTEAVFRIMADVKGESIEAEKYLLAWQSEMVKKADNA